MAQATYCGASYLLCSRLPTLGANYSPVEQATYCETGYLLWSRLPIVEQSTYSSASYLVSTEDQSTLSLSTFCGADTYPWLTYYHGEGYPWTKYL